MADNTTINPGAGGDDIATDDIGGVKFPRTKLVHGADGVNDGDVSKTNPLPVAAGASMVWFGPTAVPGTTPVAYAAGDQVGGLISLSNAARVSGGGGRIVHVSMSDADDVVSGFDLVFFIASVTPAADNAAWALSDADNDLELWRARMNYFEDNGGARKCTQFSSISIPYFCQGGTTLYAAIRTTGAFTMVASASLKYLIGLELD
jgi:hypothetical protein